MTLHKGDRVTITARATKWQAHEGTVEEYRGDFDFPKVLVQLDKHDTALWFYEEDLEVFDPAPRKGKTKEEMEAIAKQMFGEEATVYYSDYQWVIQTGVEEHFDPEQHKDHPAYAALMEPEGTYGSTLERWAHKNGHGSESMAELFDSYDAAQGESARQTVADVRRWISDGKEFDWEGGPEWRDEVLKYAEEKGW